MCGFDMMLDKKRDKINWICLKDECPENCCKLFDKKSSLKSVFNIEESYIPLTENDLERNEAIRKHAIRKADDNFYMETDEGGECPLFENGLCTIHEDRPLSCRAYPFFLNKYNGLCIDEDCPGIGEGWTEMSKVRKMIDALFSLHQEQIKSTERKLDI